MQIILASASPRRQELLKLIFDDFIIKTSSCEENATFTTPSQYVMDLAMQKALDVSNAFADTTSDFLVIGADTIVYHEDMILGKPKDKNDARQMITSLSGKSHFVFTGICLISQTGGKQTIYTAHACTKVQVASLTEAEITEYISTSEPYDKAGGYAIQGLFSRHILGIEGDYFNVVGLPIHLLYEKLKLHNLI